MFHKYVYILCLLFKFKDKSHGGRGLVMLQKQQDKGEAMLECDREYWESYSLVQTEKSGSFS